MSLSARMLLAEDNGMNMEIAEFLSENAGISGIKGYNGKEAPGCLNSLLIKDDRPDSAAVKNKKDRNSTA